MTNTASLIDRLLERGLVQFGLFGPDEVPIKINANLLQSYPDVMRALAEAAAPIAQASDHLLATYEALPFGMAVSLQADVPLVYSRGTDLPGVHDLVGAYDVGHPAVMVCNVWDVSPDVNTLIEKAARVGLEVHTLLPVFDMGNPSPGDTVVRSLVHIPDMVDRLTAAGRLPEGQGRVVRDWLAEQRV